MSINTTSIYYSPTIPVSSFPNTTIHEGMVELKPDFLKRVDLSCIVLLTFIIILTILGNTLVLVATWRERILHQPNKYFIACLAVADLLVGLFAAPARLYVRILFYNSFDNFVEVFPELSVHLSRFLVWMDVVSLTASIYTLSVISFDRYFKISKPLQYKSQMTTSKSLTMIFIIWLISSCFATYAATSSSGSAFMATLCRRQYVLNVTHLIRFYTFLSVTMFLLPIIIILIMYALIFLVAHKRRKMLRNGELGQTNNDKNKRTTFLKDLKVIRMLFIVVGAFIFCLSPSFSYLLLFYHDREILEDLSLETFTVIEALANILPLFNSVCNPIIYACFDQTYKQAFKHLFQQIMCRPTSSRLQPIDGRWTATTDKNQATKECVN